jgi:hypothetical protein
MAKKSSGEQPLPRNEKVLHGAIKSGTDTYKAYHSGKMTKPGKKPGKKL